MTRETVKARIDDHKKERFVRAIGDKTVQSVIEGLVDDTIDGDGNPEEYYEAVAQLRELEGETSEIDGRVKRIDDRIEELQAEREELVEERDEKQARIDELEAELAEAEKDAGGGGDASGRTTVEEAAREMLVAVAEDRIGTNGVTAGNSEIRDTAARAQADADEVVAEMRRMAAPAGEKLEYKDRIVERSIIPESEMQELRSSRPSPDTFDRLRRAISETVLDDDEFDSEKVPERQF